MNTVLGELVQRGPACDDSAPRGAHDIASQRADEDLPWLASNREGATDGDDDGSDDDDYITAEMSELEGLQPRSNIVVPFEDRNEDRGLTESSDTTNSTPAYSQRELRHLATVLDRLGRTLTDAAPHVACLAASMPEETSSSPSTQGNEISSEPGSLSEGDTPSAPLGGLLSLWSRERRRQNNTSGRTLIQVNVTETIDPDHMDYASGLVNTIRGEVRSGPRNRSSQDDIANLLGAYLAAASLSGLVSGNDNGDDDLAGLGRLLARGGTGGGNGGNGGGIDIHIHAVVTTGGAGVTGGTGLLGIGGGGGNNGTSRAVGTPTGTLGGATARNLFSSTRTSRSLLRSRNNNAAANNALVNVDDDNDDDLFSELYSENPSPVDPNGSTSPGEDESHPGSPIRNVASSASSDLNSRGTFEDRPMGSIDSTPQPSRRFSSVPRRQSSGRRSSGVFRLFRRRSRSSQNDESRSERSEV